MLTSKRSKGPDPLKMNYYFKLVNFNHPKKRAKEVIFPIPDVLGSSLRVGDTVHFDDLSKSNETEPYNYLYKELFDDLDGYIEQDILIEYMSDYKFMVTARAIHVVNHVYITLLRDENNILKRQPSFQ